MLLQLSSVSLVCSRSVPKNAEALSKLQETNNFIFLSEHEPNKTTSTSEVAIQTCGFLHVCKLHHLVSRDPVRESGGTNGSTMPANVPASPRPSAFVEPTTSSVLPPERPSVALVQNQAPSRTPFQVVQSQPHQLVAHQWPPPGHHLATRNVYLSREDSLAPMGPVRVCPRAGRDSDGARCHFT